jgi:hypothetical protein
MIIGIIHKDKWKQNRKNWKQMNKEERKLFLWVLAILAFGILAGLIIFFVLRGV